MVTTLILFLLINGYFIISFAFFSCGFELQFGGALEISPRALVVLKPPVCVGLVSNGLLSLDLRHSRRLIMNLICRLAVYLSLRYCRL